MHCLRRTEEEDKEECAVAWAAVFARSDDDGGLAVGVEAVLVRGNELPLPPFPPLGAPNVLPLLPLAAGVAMLSRIAFVVVVFTDEVATGWEWLLVLLRDIDWLLAGLCWRRVTVAPTDGRWRFWGFWPASAPQGGGPIATPLFTSDNAT